MMKIPALLLVAAALAGCAFITTPKEKESLAMDIGELSARAAMLEKKQNALAAEFEAIKTDSGKTRANASADISAMRGEKNAKKGGGGGKEKEKKKNSEKGKTAGQRLGRHIGKEGRDERDKGRGGRKGIRHKENSRN